MNSSWASWISQIDRVQDLDTIVYLGAGYGADLPDLLGTSARRIVLVEPNRTFHEALQAAADEADRITVLAMAVAAQTGHAPFKVFNAVSYASLRAPGGLLDLFPGLKVEQTSNVDTMTAHDLFASLELMPDKVNALIVDVPGEEGLVVKAVTDMDVTAFEHVMICCTVKTLYEGLPTTENLPQTLITQGYRLADQQLDDPVFLKFWLCYDESRHALAHLQQTSATKTQELQVELAALTQQMQTLHDADMADLRRRYAALADQKTALEALLWEVTAGLIASCEAERDDKAAGDNMEGVAQVL